MNVQMIHEFLDDAHRILAKIIVHFLLDKLWIDLLELNVNCKGCVNKLHFENNVSKKQTL